MKPNSYFIILYLFAVLIFENCSTRGSNEKTANSGSPVQSAFVSTSTVEDVRAQIDKLPNNDIWWNVYGQDQSWNFKNLHRIMPTVNVYREGQVSMLTLRTMPKIPDHMVETPEGSMTFKEFIDSDQSTTMGIVILQGGEVVYEYYPRQEPYEKPIYWSVTKVFVSAVLGILEDQGQVDVSKPIGLYLPELEGSDYKDITIRNILDMATGVACPEE